MPEWAGAGNFLSADLLLELFQYFYVDELFHLFADLGQPLPALLRTGGLPLHIRRVDRRFRQHILPRIEVQNVVSIHIRNVYQMAPVNLGQFDRVRWLTLHNVTAGNWPCRFPNRLKYLTVHVRSKHRESVLKSALSLKSVERLEFHSSFLHFKACRDKLENHSTVRHLIFDSQRCFLDYHFLRENVPHLQTLISRNTHYPHRFDMKPGLFASLHTIEMSCKHLDIAAMISFLKQIALHSLRRCRLVNNHNSSSAGIALLLISC